VKSRPGRETSAAILSCAGPHMGVPGAEGHSVTTRSAEPRPELRHSITTCRSPPQTAAASGGFRSPAAVPASEERIDGHEAQPAPIPTSLTTGSSTGGVRFYMRTHPGGFQHREPRTAAPPPPLAASSARCTMSTKPATGMAGPAEYLLATAGSLAGPPWGPVKFAFFLFHFPLLFEQLHPGERRPTLEQHTGEHRQPRATLLPLHRHGVPAGLHGPIAPHLR